MQEGGYRTGSVWLMKVCVSSVYVVVLAAALGWAPLAHAQAVGIRVTVADIRSDALEADFDLTGYFPNLSSISTPELGAPPILQRRQGVEPGSPFDLGLFPIGPFPYIPAGAPSFGYPALDYGDGSTLPYTYLSLTDTGGGPGGTNVYRNPATFTHTYPGPGNYTVRTSLQCIFCVRGQITYFPAGSPTNPTSSYSFDYVPDTIIGNLAATYRYTGTTVSPYSPAYSYRYQITYYGAITNSIVAAVHGSIQEIPTLSEWGLIALGLLLAGVGLVTLRRL